MLTSKPFYLKRDHKLIDEIDKFIRIRGLTLIVFSYIDLKIRTKEQYDRYTAVIEAQAKNAFYNRINRFIYGGIKFFVNHEGKSCPMTIGNERAFFKELSVIPEISYLEENLALKGDKSFNIKNTPDTIYSETYRLFSCDYMRGGYVYYSALSGQNVSDFFCGIEFIGSVDNDLTTVLCIGDYQYCISNDYIQKNLRKCKSYLGESNIFMLSNYIDTTLCPESRISIVHFSGQVRVNKIMLKTVVFKRKPMTKTIILNDKLYYLKLKDGDLKLQTFIETLIEDMD